MKAILTTFLLASTLFTTVAHADDFSQQDLQKLKGAVERSQDDLWRIGGSDADRDGLTEARLMKNATDCSAAVKDALAHGADPTTSVWFMTILSDNKRRDIDIKISDIDANICQALAEKSKGMDERRAKEAAAAAEAKLGPFKKLGVAGVKLAFVDKYWYQIVGPNQAEFSPQMIAKSSVLFILQKDDDWNYTLHRYQFRGNKQTGYTHRSFHTNPGPSSYR